MVLLRERTRPGPGIIEPCLPSPGSGRTPHWIKVKNPAALAVKREAQEDWGGRER